MFPQQCFLVCPGLYSKLLSYFEAAVNTVLVLLAHCVSLNRPKGVLNIVTTKKPFSSWKHEGPPLSAWLSEYEQTA